MFFGQKSSIRTTSCFLVILTGVLLTSHSIPDIHSFGSLLTFLSMLLASLKTLVNTHLLQDSFHLQPLDLVARMSPLAMIHALVFAVFNGELTELGRFVTGPDFTAAHVGAIALNAGLSLMAVLVGILTDQRTRPPSMAISGGFHCLPGVLLPRLTAIATCRPRLPSLYNCCRNNRIWAVTLTHQLCRRDNDTRRRGFAELQ